MASLQRLFAKTNPSRTHASHVKSQWRQRRWRAAGAGARTRHGRRAGISCHCTVGIRHRRAADPEPRSCSAADPPDPAAGFHESTGSCNVPDAAASAAASATAWDARNACDACDACNQRIQWLWSRCTGRSRCGSIRLGQLGGHHFNKSALHSCSAACSPPRSATAFHALAGWARRLAE